MNQIILGENQDGTFNVLIPETDTVFDAQGNPITAYTKAVVDPESFDLQLNTLENEVITNSNQITSIQNDAAAQVDKLNQTIADIKSQIDIVTATKSTYTTWKGNQTA